MKQIKKVKKNTDVEFLKFNAKYKKINMNLFFIKIKYPQKIITIYDNKVS